MIYRASLLSLLTHKLLNQSNRFLVKLDLLACRVKSQGKEGDSHCFGPCICCTWITQNDYAILIHAKWHETITILAKYNSDKYRDTLGCFQSTFFLTEFDVDN